MTDPSTLRPYLSTTLESTDFPHLGEKISGKVRDVYLQKGKNQRILITTDRQSAFDVLFCTVPLKGQVLNQLSAWWFDHVKDILPTHIISTPDPNVTVAKNLQVLPIEIVVRKYLTGSSKTAIWINYQNGVRNYCGIDLPEGMVKNQPFDHTIITPTTKGEHDDELISPAEIVSRGLTTQEQWDEIADKSLKLFARGQEIASKQGLILVDTKYEMGLDEHGTLTIADEVHTPDSSRYWIAETYEERFAAGQEPESLDKEFFRLWLREQGFEYGQPLPTITDDVRLALGARYIDLYERVTGEQFVFPENPNTEERIVNNLEEYMGATV